MTMKKAIIFFVATLGLCFANAQDRIYVHQTQGNVEAYAVKQVDSLNFEQSQNHFAIIAPTDTLRVGERITMTTTPTEGYLSTYWYPEDADIVTSQSTSWLEALITAKNIGFTHIYATADGNIASAPMQVIGRATSTGNTEIYWNLLTYDAQSGTNIPFTAEYDSKEDIEHTEIWYDVNEVEIRHAECPIVNFQYADTINTQHQQSAKAKDFAHNQSLYSEAVGAYSLADNFPVHLPDSLLSSTFVNDFTSDEAVNKYAGTDFPKKFKDKLQSRMDYADYVLIFRRLGLMDYSICTNNQDTMPYLDWITDSTYNANTATWEKHFKQNDTIWSKTNVDTIGMKIDSYEKLINLGGRPPKYDTIIVYDTTYIIKPWIDEIVYVYPQIMERVNQTWNDSVSFLDLIASYNGYSFTYDKHYLLNTEFHVCGKDNRLLKQSDMKTVSVQHNGDIVRISPVATPIVHMPVQLNVEVSPYYQSKALTYECIFPRGTKNANDEILSSMTMTNILAEFPKTLVFSHVGSQAIQIYVYDNGKYLDDYTINLHVGYQKEVPTLYYAEVNGYLKAIKLTNGDQPEDMNIFPYDLGIRSGDHPFNILYHNDKLYVLDAGAQWYYINDAEGNLGDGKISVVAKDGSTVETMLSNVGGPAFQDPFFGYIENDYLYYSDRNVGIIRLPLSTRNAIYSANEYPYYVQQNTLGYYNNGWAYGSIGGTFSKINGVWHWAKYYNGYGIFRFKDSDIFSNAIIGGAPQPEDGIALEGSAFMPKSFVYAAKSNKICFTLLGSGNEGFYVCTLDELNAITKSSDLAQYKKSFQGYSFIPDMTGKNASMEGQISELAGICQMAYDEVNDCVYFAYRNHGYTAGPDSGIYRYDVNRDQVTCLIRGVLAYGLTINNQPSKLF